MAVIMIIVVIVVVIGSCLLAYYFPLDTDAHFYSVRRELRKVKKNLEDIERTLKKINNGR
jgi:uncharacterized protein YxeA